MTDQLRLGTLGDGILRGDGDGMSVPVPLQGGISIPVPGPVFAAAGDDLPCPPIPLGAGEPEMLYGGISIPTP